MRTKNLNLGIAGVLLAGLLAGLAGGCSDGDSTPAGPDATATGQELAAEQSTQTALALINEMVEQGDSWSQGALGSATKALPGPADGHRTQTAAVWNADQQAWTWTATIDYTSGADSVAIAADYWVQFRDGASPQQYPDTATDEMEAHVAWNWDAHVEEAGSVADLDAVYQATMTVAGLHTPTRSLAGSGSMTGSAAGHNAADESFQVAWDGSWDANLDVPPDGGCPIGTARVQSGPWHLTATYDGSPTVAWELRAGLRTYASGTQSLPCGALSAEGAQQQSLLALGAVNDLLGALPNWLRSAPGASAKATTGTLPRLSTMAGCEVGAPQSTAPLYSGETSAWTWSWSLGCESATDWFSLSSDLWLQYRSGEVAQSGPEGATEMEVRQSLSMSAHAESGSGVDDAALEGSMHVTAGGLLGDPVTITGNGSLAGHVSHTGTEPQYAVSVAVEWQMDLAVPAAGGCPSGHVIAQLGDYSLDAQYDGSSLAHWVLTRDGAALADGTTALNCAN